MPFGKNKRVEESINDKFVRLFTEGMTVEQISKENDVKPDVIANVIRRRLGEDALPETVVRSKNAVPHPTEPKLKADTTPNEPAPKKPEEKVEEPVSEEQSSEGLSKLEQFMLQKEKKKADEPSAEPEKGSDEPELGVMEEISLDEAAILEKLGGEAPASSGVSPVIPASDDDSADMAGLETTDISEKDIIKEAPIDAYSKPDIVEDPVPEPEPEPAPAPKPTIPMPNLPHGNGGSAFDKMKAFAKMQVAANNERLAELEAKLGGVEGDYTAQLEAAEKAVSEAKVKYEDVIKSGDDIDDRNETLKKEHRAALARAEDDYRRKQEELDNEYNEAITRANSDYALKQDKLNAESEEINSKKESAKQDFLAKQREVNKIKDKISSEVDSVRAEIASLKEENKGYESFLN